MAVIRSLPVEIDIEAELLATYPALVKRLMIVVRDPATAEDLAQTAFARAIDHRGDFRGTDVRAWLYTIGLRLAFNELRRRRRSSAVTGHETAEPTWALETDPDLWAALAELDPQHRAALILSALEGYTHTEIGRILGVRIGTVSSWLSRTKSRLRDRLGDDR